MDMDRIEKKILLRAPRHRVWRALADAGAFGAWFGVNFHGAAFAPGATLRGVLSPTRVNAEVAQMQKAHEGKAMDITIERMEPERVFSFRWHPCAVDPAYDYSAEPTTLIEFTLEDAPGGVMLTVRESGFAQIPLARRAQAFQANDRGWGIMVKVFEEYLVQTP